MKYIIAYKLIEYDTLQEAKAAKEFADKVQKENFDKDPLKLINEINIYKLEKIA